MPHTFFSPLRLSCFVAFLLSLSVTALAKDEANKPSVGAKAGSEQSAVEQPASKDSNASAAQTASVTPSSVQPEASAEAPDVVEEQSSEPVAAEPFRLPASLHPWANFQPGAWREIETTTETFDESGRVVNRNITSQKEVLQSVVEGKYVLQVQATVDLGGKRIVGDWKNRVLHLETDSVVAVAESLRLADETLAMAGQSTECQVWELSYSDGARKLMDRIHFDPMRFPAVLRRETFEVHDQAEASDESAVVAAEQTTELTAREVPYVVGKKLFACSCLRTQRRRSKGDSQRISYLSEAVPGGEVAVQFTDFDAEGRRVRWSVARLLSFGLTAEEYVSAPGEPLKP